MENKIQSVEADLTQWKIIFYIYNTSSFFSLVWLSGFPGLSMFLAKFHWRPPLQRWRERRMIPVTFLFIYSILKGTKASVMCNLTVHSWKPQFVSLGIRVVVILLLLVVSLSFFRGETVVSSSVQFSSVTQSCPTLCDSMNRSMPGLPIHHQLPESTHVHRVGDAIQPSRPLSSPSPPAFNLSQHQGLFQWLSCLHEVAKVLEFQLQHQSFQWTPRTDLL